MIVLERRFKPLPAEPDSTPEPDAATIRKATAKIRAAAAEEGEEEDEPEVIQDLFMCQKFTLYS